MQALLALSIAIVQPALPLYSLSSNSTAWPQRNALGQAGLVLGDIRARVEVHNASALSATAQIFWRRRDPRPAKKTVVVTDASGAAVHSITSLLESGCGIVTFDTSGARGPFFAYYLPHYESGGDANLHFHWFNCTAQTRDCTLYASDVATGRRLRAAAQHHALTCDAPLATASATVSGLENRPNAVAERDHAVGALTFNGFTAMELIALPAEIATLPTNALNVFLESRENMVRMFDHNVPAGWARDGERRAMTFDNVSEGEFFVFQVGLFANALAAQNISVAFSDLVPHAAVGALQGAPIPRAACTCFNLGGVDQHGTAFTKTFNLAANTSGSLWMGVDFPPGATGTYTLDLSIGTASGESARGAAPTATPLVATFNVGGDGGGAIARHGDDDVYALSRLRWLNSDIGVDDVAAWPRSRFVNVSLVPRGTRTSELVLRTVNKDVAIGANGLPSQATVRTVKRRFGKNESRSTAILAAPVRFAVFDADGNAMTATVTKAAAIVKRTADAVTWRATSSLAPAPAPGSGSGSTLELVVTGTLAMDSYMTFSAAVTSIADRSVEVSDVRLIIAANASHAPRMLGMGAIGSRVHDVTWRWELKSGVGNNRLWLGDVDAGVYVTPRGPGDLWSSPMYGRDYPIYPYLPNTWAGANATNATSSLYGANITTGGTAQSARGDRTGDGDGDGNDAVVATIFSGRRTIAASAASSTAASTNGDNGVFLFDLIFTPSHPLELKRQYAQRYVQVGYGGQTYATPAALKARGANVITLHQGISGVFNGTMVNPYINYPFVPATVDFMENYTQQAHALEVVVKFYYTIRELSNHAVELFALKALQGEVLLAEDPYTEPQAGYCHSWDCHGGDAYLHQHVVNEYVYCWQQSLANGEVDASVCDIGTSRWFNYYLEGPSSFLLFVIILFFVRSFFSLLYSFVQLLPRRFAPLRAVPSAHGWDLLRWDQLCAQRYAARPEDDRSRLGNKAVRATDRRAHRKYGSERPTRGPIHRALCVCRQVVEWRGVSLRQRPGLLARRSIRLCARHRRRPPRRRGLFDARNALRSDDSEQPGSHGAVELLGPRSDFGAHADWLLGARRRNRHRARPEDERQPYVARRARGGARPGAVRLHGIVEGN
jgi:hypothetical protein